VCCSVWRSVGGVCTAVCTAVDGAACTTLGGAVCVAVFLEGAVSVARWSSVCCRACCSV